MRKHYCYAVAKVLAACLGLAANSGYADEYHYVNMLVGDRAAGMGGAYTGVADDPVGAYYNPAGLAYTQGRNLSASMNTFSTATTKYKDVLAGNGWERTSSSLLPNFFGVTQPVSGGVAGFSYAVPDSTLEDQDQLFHNLPANIDNNPATVETATQYAINFYHTDNTYNIGPSYALLMNDKWSAGLSLYGHARKEKLIVNQLIEVDTNQDGLSDVYEWTNSYYQLEELGVRPILGIMWNALDKLAVGATVSKVSLFSSNIQSQRTFKGTDIAYSNGGTIDFSLSESALKREYPLAAAAGFAYFPNNRLLISGDATYHASTANREATWNAAAGMEYYLNERWALRSGIFSDRANTSDLVAGVKGQAPHVDLYGLSASLSRFTRNSSITVGGSFSTGNGKAQIVSGSAAIQDVQTQAVLLFLSAAYSY